MFCQLKINQMRKFKPKKVEVTGFRIFPMFVVLILFFIFGSMNLSELTRRTELAVTEVLPFIPEPKPLNGDSPKKRSLENSAKLKKHVRIVAKKYGITEKRILTIILRK